MRIGPHAAIAERSERPKLGHQPAALVEERLWLIATHPVLEQLQMALLRPNIGDRNLMSAPEALDLLAVDLSRPRPALGASQHQYGPGRACLFVGRFAGLLLDRGDAVENPVERVGHQAVHRRGIAAFDEEGLISVPPEEVPDLLIACPPEDRRIGDLVAVEMQDRQHGAVVAGVQEAVRMPGGGKRPGLGLAVADDAGDDQPGIVERRPMRMHQRVAELPAFMDRARRFRRGVAWNATRKGELPHELAEPLHVLADVGVDLAIGAFEIGIGHHAGPAMSRPANIDDVRDRAHG